MLQHWQSSWRRDKAAATGDQIKEKGPRSMPVSFLFLSQSEIHNLTLSLFLGGTCKKLLELWHCFVLRCARERPYLPRVIVNMLWIGDIQPIRAASEALTSFVGERKKYSQSHPATAEHPRCASQHNPITDCLFPGCTNAFPWHLAD